jgi:GH25 family lysozyme M1 (1,4-beta-N-acetylmuramidase)
MSPTWIVDLSNWQAGINIEQIAREGYSAVICKATEGSTFRDAQFDGWIPRIRNTGMIPGAYHFLRAGSGSAQARAFHARLAAHGGPAGFLCALDNEKDATLADTRAFVAEWSRLTNNHPLIMYTGAWWWRPRGWDGASLTPYLWHSQYVSGSGFGSALYATVPDAWWTPGYGNWPSATLLQFSSKGRVAGQNVDVDAFRGSVDELRALTRPGSTPAPTPPPSAPAWPGRYFRYVTGATARQRVTGVDVRTWQARMRERGWAITADGDYGPASRDVCVRFQREKHLTPDGIVGPATWAAAWTAPIT